MKKIKNGDKVIDNVTKLEGTVVATCVYLNGCIQYLVQPKVIDHRIVEGYWIDESQLKLILPPKKPKLPKRPAIDTVYMGSGGGVRSHPGGH